MKLSIAINETIDEINMLLEQEGMNTLPDLFKHMVLAIFRKGPRSMGWFQQSVHIAFEFLLKYGHITRNSNLNRMALTRKGKSYNKRHEMEPPAKSQQFDNLLNRFVQE
jgi:hypothetical protein